MQNARSPNWRRCALCTTNMDPDDARNVLLGSRMYCVGHICEHTYIHTQGLLLDAAITPTLENWVSGTVLTAHIARINKLLVSERKRCHVESLHVRPRKHNATEAVFIFQRFQKTIIVSGD